MFFPSELNSSCVAITELGLMPSDWPTIPVSNGPCSSGRLKEKSSEIACCWLGSLDSRKLCVGECLLYLIKNFDVVQTKCAS